MCENFTEDTSILASSSMPKGIQLFTGWRDSNPYSPYESYSNSDIVALAKFTTDFVINAGSSTFSYYNATTPVLTVNDINGLQLSATNVGTAANLENLKTTYKSKLSSASPALIFSLRQLRILLWQTK